MERCDLHVHSMYSDGTCTPEEILALAEKAGLSHVALTDHNTAMGLPRFLDAARGGKVIPVPGIELSTAYEGVELHLLGLFLPRDAFEAVHGFVEEMHRLKDENNRSLIAALRRAGYDMDYDALASRVPGGHINRAHIGAELARKGYVADIDEAVKGLLAPGKGFYQPPERLNTLAAIGFLRAQGAVTVLAHPFLQMTEEQLNAFLPLARAAGLQAMETCYSLYDAATRQAARALAAWNGLLESGGSDFHGQNKPAIHLGTGYGSLYVPSALALQLEKMAKETQRPLFQRGNNEV